MRLTWPYIATPSSACEAGVRHHETLQRGVPHRGILSGWQLSSLQAIADPVVLATIGERGRRSGRVGSFSVPKDIKAEYATTIDWLCLTLHTDPRIP